MNKITKKQFKKMSKSTAFNKVVAPMYEKLDKSDKLLKEAKVELTEVKYEFEDISLAFGLLQATFTDIEKEAANARKEAEKQRIRAEEAEARAEAAEAKAAEGLELNKEVRNELDKLCDQFDEASIEYDSIEKDMNNIIENKVTISKQAENVMFSNLYNDTNKDIIFNAMCNEVKRKERQVDKRIRQLEGINSRKNNIEMKIGILIIENRG